MVDKIDKIDLEDLLKDFKELNQEAFILYVKSVWKDLSQRSDKKDLGIDKNTFAKYYDLSTGRIIDRLFAVFDSDKDGYLSLQDFYDGMVTLFTKPFDELSDFIFKMYDANNDGKISRDDVKDLFQYIHISTSSIKAAKNIDTSIKFSDRVESQIEIQEKLDSFFGSSTLIDYKTFKSTIENKDSDVFVFLLIFLLENRPFKKATIDAYIGCIRSNSKSPKVSNTVKISIASPTISSRFSPSKFLTNSPVTKKSNFKEKNKGNGINILGNYLKKDDKNVIKLISTDTEDVNIGQSLNPGRKVLKTLKNLEDTSITKKKIISNNNEDNDISKLEGKAYDNKGYKDDDFDTNMTVKYEGYIYKLTENNKFKKLWFVLLDKHFFYYKEKGDTVQRGMHNLSGIYFKSENPRNIEGKTYYCFSMIYPQKSREYFVENKEEYNNWIRYISSVVGHSDLTLKYEIGPKLGNGKFGVVKLAVNKQSGEKLAAKFMSKKEMSNVDLELVRNEIEILKVCQHPNIIKIFDVYENADFIYIFMEYCEGGDLFTRLEKTKFKISEKKAAEYTIQLLNGIYYLHEYGIVHRDLKPENVLMSDNSENAVLKIIDFGLSKIIGNDEKCSEPYGTLSYVAPEVLQEKPYNKKVDIWTLGIMSYLFLVGFLPFDDKHESEIAKKTMSDPTPFPSSYWKNISSEAKSFVDSCLNKNPQKRITIKECLLHPWIAKYTQKSIIDGRKDSKINKEGEFESFSKN